MFALVPALDGVLQQAVIDGDEAALKEALEYVKSFAEEQFDETRDKDLVQQEFRHFYYLPGLRSIIANGSLTNSFLRRVPIDIFVSVIMQAKALGTENEDLLRDLTVQILSLMIDCTERDVDFAWLDSNGVGYESEKQ